jgi:hypothetical protein
VKKIARRCRCGKPVVPRKNTVWQKFCSVQCARQAEREREAVRRKADRPQYIAAQRRRYYAWKKQWIKEHST